ncbi:hypothetical protein ACU686_16360 [Yinghuangia aomiensis]
MMGLPVDPGWVTGVPGLPRTAQLRALGNGVVPQQALHALHELAAEAARSGVSNLLTTRPARTPRHHRIRTRHYAQRPRPPPHLTGTPPHCRTTSDAPPPHHPPTPRKAHTVNYTDDTTTWTDTDTTATAEDAVTVSTHGRKTLLLTPDEAGALVRRSGGWMRRKAAAGRHPLHRPRPHHPVLRHRTSTTSWSCTTAPPPADPSARYTGAAPGPVVRARPDRSPLLGKDALMPETPPRIELPENDPVLDERDGPASAASAHRPRRPHHRTRRTRIPASDAFPRRPVETT